MNIFFASRTKLSFLCSMKQLAVLLLLVFGYFSTSCTSEYEERLEQGLDLKEQISEMETGSSSFNEDHISKEIETIRNEISLLARVSGNEDLFLSQIYKD